MNVLSIGSDKKLFEEGSEVCSRIAQYGTLVDELHIIVFALSKTYFKKKQIAKNVWIYPTNSKNRLYYFFDAIRIGNNVLKSRNDERTRWLITTQDPFESGLVGYILKRKHKIPLNVQEHGDFFSARHWRNESILNFFRFYLGKFLLKKADCIRVVAERIKKTLVKQGISEQKINVVPVRTPIDSLIMRSHSADTNSLYPEADCVLLTMARFVKQKNLSLLLKVFRRVVDTHPKALLLIVGDGPEKKRLLSLCNRLGLQENVVFLSWTEDIVTYYKRADIYILTSNYEGWGRVIIESMALNLPVIMTDVGCAREIVVHEKNGLISPIGDKASLVRNINKCIEDKQFRMKLAKNAMNTIQELPTEQDHLAHYRSSWEVCLK